MLKWLEFLNRFEIFQYEKMIQTLAPFRYDYNAKLSIDHSCSGFGANVSCKLKITTS